VQASRLGLQVRLYEMRPGVMTPAHRSGRLAELVCSSSLKSDNPETAHGLLKEEMRALGSVVLECAAESAVPGGDALCVDRDAFADLVTRRIESDPNIQVIRSELIDIPAERPCIVATGPLTSPKMCESIVKTLGCREIRFFDAIAPSVYADSIDRSKVFAQSRYDKGEAAYLNCPMNREEYERFIDELLSARIAHLHLDEERDPRYFEGCLPIEVIARRGRDTLAHGAMKPVGLTDPRTGRRPYAVVQLRQENAEASIYGLVGFQTQLRQSEQERVFRLIPGLERAVFARYGAVHRNTYIDSPRHLEPTLRSRIYPGLFFAGQLTGVEGYMESAASGIVAGLNAGRFALGLEPSLPPLETMIGALLHYVSCFDGPDFQPMNSNLGLLPAVNSDIPKQMRRKAKLDAARKAMAEWVAGMGGDVLLV